MRVRIDIFTLFPQMFDSPLGSGILKRAVDQGLLEFEVHNIRDYTHDKHHTTDDYPYGGGAGMVFKPEPVFEAVETVRGQITGDDPAGIPVILLTPQGRLFSQDVALELSRRPHLMLICGHYEGVDERIAEHLATDAVSIGDYVLSGGELAAMVVADAVARLIPGVLGSAMSPLDESHTTGLLEYPHYTRPPEFRGWTVPDVLLSGNHGEISKWRRKQAIVRTFKRRPDMLENVELSPKEEDYVEALRSALDDGEQHKDRTA
jgi:tRNA (guanine37-N1)-methyltransferase